MTRPILLATVGLPGSGKTTAAHRIATQLGWCEISRDGIRRNLGCYPIGNAEDESAVSWLQQERIRFALTKGRSIVVHDTNVRQIMPDGTGSPLDRLRRIAERYGAEFRVLDLRGVPVEECIRRQAGRPVDEQVPEAVIRAMAEQAAAMPSIPEHELWTEDQP